MKDVVIVAAVRTPVGKFQAAFAEISAVELGAIAVREAVKRAGGSMPRVEALYQALRFIDARNASVAERAWG